MAEWCMAHPWTEGQVMGLRLRRQLGPISHLERGEYTVETPTGEPALSCPQCSRVSDLDCGVHVGGVVAQIWSCPYADCSFIEYLSLDHWGEPVVPAPRPA